MSTAILYGRHSQANLGGIIADLTTKEDHTLSATVTSHPVEEGAEVSDHIRNAPRTLTLEQIVSQTPLQDGLKVKADHVGETWDLLKQLWKKAEPITVVSSLEVYDNMAIERVSVNRDPSNTGYLRYSVQLKQIRLAKSQTVSIPPGRVGKKQAKGDAPGTLENQVRLQTQKGQTQTSPVEIQNRSGLHGIFSRKS